MSGQVSRGSAGEYQADDLIASKAQETMRPSLLSSLPLFFSSSAQFLTVENGLELNMASLLFSTCTLSLDDPGQTMAFVPSLPS